MFLFVCLKLFLYLFIYTNGTSSRVALSIASWKTNSHRIQSVFTGNTRPLGVSATVCGGGFDKMSRDEPAMEHVFLALPGADGNGRALMRDTATIVPGPSQDPTSLPRPTLLLPLARSASASTLGLRRRFIPRSAAKRPPTTSSSQT